MMTAEPVSLSDRSATVRANPTLWIVLATVGALATVAAPLNPAEIVGEWIRESKGAVLTFNTDGTLQIRQESGAVAAKYRIDPTKRPHHIDVFDFEPASAAPEGGRQHGIFELESGNRLKFEMAKERPKEFSDNADTAVRRGSHSAAEPSIVGEWVNEVPIKEGYIFAADETVRTFYRYRNEEPRQKEYKYRVDYSTSPHRIDFYRTSEAVFRGIIAFDGDARLKLEGNFTLNENERPKQFSAGAEILSRVR